MKFSEETACIAVPCYAGFVPSLRYQFGATYGNATRQILETDPSLHQGKLQTKAQNLREFHQLKKNLNSNGGENSSYVNEDFKPKIGLLKRESNSNTNTVKFELEEFKPPQKNKLNRNFNEKKEEDNYVWKLKNKYHTGDDRFSFPPVPGYTGFIPRSKEHFGQPYVETTNESLIDFQNMLRSRKKLPPQVEEILKTRKEKSEKEALAKAATQAEKATQGNKNISSSPSTQKPTYCYSAQSSPIDDVGPYKSARGSKNQTFISGYTGFVPRLQKHFGEPYPESVRHAIEEFTDKKPDWNPYFTSNDGTKVVSSKDKVKVDRAVETRPIPGCTVFIPGSKYGFATTFGKTSEIAYEAFNHREPNGKMPSGAPNSCEAVNRGFPFKDLKKDKPIAGYRGHIPGR
ncbi:hypothetical protein HK099_002468, partial [Clydaea vesicula]